MSTEFGVVDWCVFGALIAASFLIGVFSSVTDAKGIQVRRSNTFADLAFLIPPFMSIAIVIGEYGFNNYISRVYKVKACFKIEL